MDAAEAKFGGSVFKNFKLDEKSPAIPEYMPWYAQAIQTAQ